MKQYKYFSFISAGTESRKYQIQAATSMIIKKHALQNSAMLPTRKYRLRRNSSWDENMCQTLVPIFKRLELKKNVMHNV